ncbi:hypothetical protein P3T73_11800 [Kiritimatiellota bacterium B12222]|nr:hypothetical protein P3T73_11800 [Kiritimatiellota bacterium B12222]
MSDTIQPLLERIQKEGLQKAETQRDQILADAKSKAASLLEDAKAEAIKIKADAEKQAEASVARGQTALEQAARDLLLKLRTEMARQVNTAAEKAATATLSSEEILSQVLPELAKSGSGNFELEAGSATSEKLKALLPALLRDSGKGGEVVMNPKSGAGFQLRFSESAEAVDFSSQAVADWVSQLLRPELSALLRPQTDKE